MQTFDPAANFGRLSRGCIGVWLGGRVEGAGLTISKYVAGSNPGGGAVECIIGKLFTHTMYLSPSVTRQYYLIPALAGKPQANVTTA